MRTQVVIVGGGPSGMLLAHLLHARGIESVVVEQRSRAYVEARIRAGVVEQGSADLLRSMGLGARMDTEGDLHDGTTLSNARRPFRVDFHALTGKRVMIYGQTEIQKDLYASADQLGLPVYDEAEDVTVTGLTDGLSGGHGRHDGGPTVTGLAEGLADRVSGGPAGGPAGGHGRLTGGPVTVTFSRHGQAQTVTADWVAGCDGFHGVCRTLIPAAARREYERVYPFGWLGVLSETPPVSHELIYARHDDGFALCSMRNEMLSRYYVQCPAGDVPEAWSDERFWSTLRSRLPEEAADTLVTGASIEKSVTPLRSYVAEPMRHGRLFLAGDAAHIVPPTGAKGLNLAFSDVWYLAGALAAYYGEGSTAGLDGYSATALARVWKAVRFSWWMTSMMHAFPDSPGEQGGFGPRVQEAELDYLASSPAAQMVMAENYVGLPY